MGNLSNLYISQSYQSLIHLGNDSTVQSSLVGLQDGLGNPIGVAVNATGDLSISGSFTASLQTGYAWIGDSNGKTRAVATSSFATTTDLTALNAFTASQNTKNTTLGTYTGSVDTKFTTIGSQSGSWINTSLNTFTASQETKNNTLGAYTASNDTKWNTVGSQSGSWVNVPLTSLNAFTASQETKNSTLASYTGSVNSSLTQLNSFTASENTKASTLATYTGSVDTKFTTIGSQSGSWDNTNLNAFSASQITKDSTLATYTGSIDTKFTTLGTQSGSWITNSQTSSMSVNFAVTSSKAQDLYVNAKNTSGATITKGSIVKITGASGDNPEIGLADWTNDGTSANTLGITTEDIAINAFSDIVVQGRVIGLNTNGFTAGQLIFLGPNGTIVASVPTPYHEVRLGQVLRSNINQGSIYLSIDNGYELTELHDVNIVTASLANNDLLAYDSVSQQWTNKTTSQLGIATTGSNTFTGTNSFQNITAVSASFQYVQSVTGSSVNIGESFIVLNNDTPVERYAGIVVVDSGSVNTTASFQFDGQTNDWFYEYTGSDPTNFGVALFGPEYSTKGSPVYNTANRIVKGNGSHHIIDSTIYDDGSLVSIGVNLNVTGSIQSNGTSVLLNGALSQLNSFTSSQESKNTTLATYTGSVNTQLTNLSTSQSIDNQKWINISAQSSSWDATADITQLNAFTASQETKNSTLATYTGSVDTKFTTLGTYTGSIDTKNSTLATYTGSVDTKFATIGTQSGSWENVPLTSLNQFTASQESKNTTLATYTGSVDTKFTTIGAYTSSIDTKFVNLAGQSGSWNQGYNSTLALNTYTQSNDTKWNTLGGVTGSYATTGSNAFVGTQRINGNTFITGSTTISGSFNVLTPLSPNESQIDFIKLPQFVGANGTTYPNATFSLGDYASSGIDQTFWIEFANASFEKYSALLVGPSRTQFIVGTGTGYDYDVIELLDNNNNTTTAKVKADTVILQGTTELTGSLTISSSAAVELNVIGNSAFTGSLSISGSINTSVIPLTITSNTASLNASSGSTFQLNLVSGSQTRLEVSGTRSGQTLNILVSQSATGPGTLVFGSNIEQSSGSFYSASQVASGEDILTVATFINPNRLYLANIKNFI